MDDAKESRGSRRSKVSDWKPHFFKVVFSPVSQGLRIPTSFMEDYGDSFKNQKKVILKVPNGDSWPVELRETEIGTWLGKGWEEFALYYEIEPRHFLVFRYEGNQQFHVLIFDESASEIKYPVEGYHTEPETDRPSMNKSRKNDAKPVSSRRTPGRKRKTTGMKDRGVERKRRKSGMKAEGADDGVEISTAKSGSKRRRSKGRKAETMREDASEGIKLYHRRLRQGVRELNRERNLNYTATHIFSS